MLLRENCETSNALVTFNGSLRGSRHLGLDSREEEGGLFGHDIYICIDLLQTKSTPFKSFNAKTIKQRHIRFSFPFQRYNNTFELYEKINFRPIQICVCPLVIACCNTADFCVGQ